MIQEQVLEKFITEKFLTNRTTSPLCELLSGNEAEAIIFIDIIIPASCIGI